MKRRRYLNRVSITILCLIFIPIVLLSVFVWQRVSRELKKSNAVYYNQVVNSFSSDFEDRLAALQEHAISIVLDSKVDKSIFHEGLKKAKTNYYWYYQAVREMQELYFHYNASYCGIYYYDTDRIITVSGAVPKQYFLSGLDIRDSTHKAWEFFGEEKHVSGSWVFSSTYMDPDKNAYMLAGYCTELGKNKDKVMIFYALSRDDYAGMQSVVYEQSGINFYILDGEREDTYMFIGDSRVSDGAAYSCRSDWLPLTYEICVTDNSLANSSELFYKDTWLILIVLTVILALICAASIVIVYRPVFSITSELENPDRETDEFGNIRNALGQRREKITEQENLIMDLLLKHLIHGVPISQERISRLGVDQRMDHYCVFVIDGQVLPASEAEKLAEKIEEELSARLFCTDWQGENKSILILFQQGPDIEAAEAVLNQWLLSHSGEHRCLIMGTAVNRLDNIRDSFLSCLERLNARTRNAKPIKEEINSLAERNKLQKDLEKRILEFLEVHFRDQALSQVKVADAFQISTYTLSRLFKNQVGLGFTEYVNSKRLEYAKDLLLTTSYSIKEISVLSGYASESYFGRIFKATYGVSPSMFKEQ